MALKRKITKAEHDALLDVFKSEYKAEGDGFVLDLEDSGFEALKAEKAEEKRKREEVEAKLSEMNAANAKAAEAARKAAEDAARAAGDVSALEASWKDKHARDVEAERRNTATATAALNALLVSQVADSMAERISTVPSLLSGQIRGRLKLEIIDGTPVTRVLDAAGKPSALSVAELEKEFLDNKDFAPIIKASQARGGGAGAGGEGDGAPKKKLSEMTATEEAAFANANPAEYAKMVE